jgi:hypothetical protein
VGSMLYTDASAIMRNGTRILDKRMLWMGEFIENSTEEYHRSSSTSLERISHSHLVPLENHNWSSLLARIDRFFDLVSKEYSFSLLDDRVEKFRSVSYHCLAVQSHKKDSSLLVLSSTSETVTQVKCAYRALINFRSSARSFISLSKSGRNYLLSYNWLRHLPNLLSQMDSGVFCFVQHKSWWYR